MTRLVLVRLQLMLFSMLLQTLLLSTFHVTLAWSHTHGPPPTYSGKYLQWKRLIKEAIKDEPRLSEFSDAIWHVQECNQPALQQWLQSPIQQCDAPFPGLTPAQPLHDPNDFPWSYKLESNWHIVRDELEQYLRQTNQQEARPWTTSTTKLCDSTEGFIKLALQDHEGKPTATGNQNFPRTLELLRNALGLDLGPRPININCQKPNSGLAPHSDNMNFLLTCHLAVKVPPNCNFHIGQEDYSWENGKLVVADTSFVHSTRNPSATDPRYVLSFCIWHPKLTLKERQGIVTLHALLQDFVPNEKT